MHVATTVHPDWCWRFEPLRERRVLLQECRHLAHGRQAEPRDKDDCSRRQFLQRPIDGHAVPRRAQEMRAIRTQDFGGDGAGLELGQPGLHAAAAFHQLDRSEHGGGDTSVDRDHGEMQLFHVGLPCIHSGPAAAW